MTNPIDDFDYRRIEIKDFPPHFAHCWRDMALARFETIFADGGDRAITLIKKKLEATELWCGLIDKGRGYEPIITIPCWKNIDAGALGLKTIHQFFPSLASMEAEDFDLDKKQKERMIGIFKHTDAIPLIAVLDILHEHYTGKSLNGTPVIIPHHPYKGT